MVTASGLTDEDLYFRYYLSRGSFDETTLPTGATVIFRDAEHGNPIAVEYPLGEGLVLATDISWQQGYNVEHTYGAYAGKAYHQLFYHLMDFESPIVESPSIDSPGEHVYVIPASARATGSGGTNWMSDVVLHNAGHVPATANLFFVKAGRDNSTAQAFVVGVPSTQSVKLGDVVAQAFAETAAAGAIIVGSNSPLLVSSRTYNNAPNGTYGQFIPGHPISEAMAGSQSATLIQLTESDRYRTNLGLVNPTAERVEVRVDVYRADGGYLGAVTRSVEAYGFVQENNFINRVTSQSVPDAYAVVTAAEPGARYFAYASSVDNASGDPMYMAPMSSTQSVIVVPAAAHVQGANNTVWRTDVEVLNQGGAPATYLMQLLKADQDNSTPASDTFTIPGGTGSRHEDVLAMFDFTGAGALRIIPQNGAISVTSRTYNDLGTATYGQFIPGIAEGDALIAGDRARLVQLAYSTDSSSGLRTNLGLTSVCSERITVEVDLFSGDGTLLGARAFNLAPFAYHQENNVFRLVTSANMDDGYVEVSSGSPGALFFAYASVVDNSSGDPVYVPARRLQ